ncbi:MAG: DNA-binding protein WhiA [Clostridia bacterium]|nr:DNA-binding protein WhiA [Clostridia bacterium]
MTYTESVRDELIHNECGRECCARAELCAALLLSGGVSFRGRDRYGLRITVSRPSVSRYYFSLIKKYFAVSCDISMLKLNRLGEQTEVRLEFPQDSVERIMDELMLRDENALFGVKTQPADQLIQRDCCRDAFIKSAFLITGCISNPEREYSLTLSCAGEETALWLKELLHARSMKAETNLRRGRFIVYMKDAESISVLLTVTGAHTARLKLENTRIMKELRNNTNRLTNCDSGNIEKTVRTAARQIADITYLAETVGMDKLPAWARETASLRLENPDTPLSELARLTDPPIGKSGLNNRLRRLSEMAEKAREGENGS